MIIIEIIVPMSLAIVQCESGGLFGAAHGGVGERGNWALWRHSGTFSIASAKMRQARLCYNVDGGNRACFVGSEPRNSEGLSSPTPQL